MTNENRYGGLVIIMASYQADMQSMIDTNQGLKSHFKCFIAFSDWHPSDCCNFFQTKLHANYFSIGNHEQSMLIVEKGFRKLLSLKGWGNARDVLSEVL